MDSSDLDLTADFIDLSDITDRIDELTDGNEFERKCKIASLDDDERDEVKKLEDILGVLEGRGGDHQWRGNWYPDPLIADSHFARYAQDLAEEMGLKKSEEWPYNHIDWVAATAALRQDFIEVKIEGKTYLCR